MSKATKYIVIQLVLVAMMLIALAGCKTQQPIVQTVEVVRTEKEIIRDTTITIEPDSASILAFLRCDSAYNVVLDELLIANGNRIDANVSLAHNGKGTTLQVDCREDSLEHEIQLRDKVIEELHNTVQTVQVEIVPNYYRRVSTGFWILLAILVVIVGWKVAKIYFKIQSGGIL